MEILAKPRPIAMLYNRSTRYEAALIGPDGGRLARLAFDAKRTKRALLNIMADKGADILRIVGDAITDDDEFTWTKGGWTLGARGYRVAWTGETERDVASKEGNPHA